MYGWLFSKTHDLIFEDSFIHNLNIFDDRFEVHMSKDIFLNIKTWSNFDQFYAFFCKLEYAAFCYIENLLTCLVSEVSWECDLFNIFKEFVLAFNCESTAEYYNRSVLSNVDETTAAIGTMAASTQQSGSEVARAFKAILLNIRQVSDEDENIDSEGLTKYEKACNALNVKLKETKNGVLALRDPMEVLKELSTEYNKLDESDIRRTNLLSSVGGKVYLVIQKCITGMNLIAGNPLEPCPTI